MTAITDTHTHRTDAAGAIINVEPGFDAFIPGMTYSAGIHPWHTPCDADTLARLDSLAAHPQVAAIGECGLDSLRGAPIGEQLPVFEHQARMAMQMGKPMIIHCVRSFNPLIDLRRRLSPGDGAPWIVHGFRGKPQLALQLAREGFSLSFGEHGNPDSARAVIERYPEQFFLETDESSMSIAEIAASLHPLALETSTNNLTRIFQPWRS